MKLRLLVIMLALLATGCGGGGGTTDGELTLENPVAVAPPVAPPGPPANPPIITTSRRVTINGYTDHSMEPFLSRDGQTLFFNNRNAGNTTDLHYATRVDDFTFNYQGPLAGANTPTALDAVASASAAGEFLFVSTRDYATTLNTIFGGQYAAGNVAAASAVQGLTTSQLGRIVFDVELAADGTFLIYAEGDFDFIDPAPQTADMFIARRAGTFSFARDGAALLSQVNTVAGREYAPAISADGLSLGFTRLEPDNSVAIYISRRAALGQPFGAPSRLNGLETFLEAPTWTPAADRIYYHALENNVFRIFTASIP